MAQDEISIADEFRQKYQEQSSKIGRFNLAIFGKTGVGKSTLVNAVFGEDVAPTGIGQPVTMTEHLYLHRSGFLGLLDTRGIEIGIDADKLIAELGDYVKRMRTQEQSEQVHVVWYCVRATDRRFEDAEARFVRQLHDLGLPVIMVMTQVPSRDGVLHHDSIKLAEQIAEMDLPIVYGRPVPVMAQPDAFVGQQAHGLTDLLDATFHVAPEGVAAALAAAQKIDMGHKRRQAEAAIVSASVLAAAAGATPIPIADAALLVPIQLGLMARVAAIYGVKIENATLAATVATSLATNVGRSLVGGLLKLLPGVGTAIGGAINAGVASLLTLALGYAWAEVCRQLAHGWLRDANGLLDQEALRELFMTELLAWVARLKADAP